MRSTHRNPVSALALGALAAGVVASAAAAAPAPRAADTLSGRVAAATGHWRHDGGRLAVRLVPGAGTDKRALVIRVSGTSCAGRHGCLVLSGKLTGTISAQASHPDGGARFTIKASGTVAPLGHVSATGSAIGTGNIARGRVTLRLTFTDARGKLTVSLASAPVGAFSSP